MSDAHIYCTQCGTQLAAGQKFCHECGAPTSAASNADAQRTDEATSSASQSASASDQMDVVEGEADAVADRAASTEDDASPDSASASLSDKEGASDSSVVPSETSESDGVEEGAEDGGCSDEDASDDPCAEEDAQPDASADAEEPLSQDGAARDEDGGSGSVDDAADSRQCAEAGTSTDKRNEGSDSAADESVSDIDIDDSIDLTEGLQGTRPIPVVASSQVPVVSEGVSTSSARPGNTTPMPLVTESSSSYAYREDTQVLDPVAAAPKQYRQDSGVPASSRDTKRTVLMVVIAVLLVVLVALLAVLAFGSDRGSDNDAAAPQATEQADAEPAGNEVVQADEPTEEPTSSQDRAIYNKLNTYYDHLGSYDSDISAAADDFNSNYLIKSYSKRSAFYDDASQLMQEISRDYDALQSMSVASSSEYYASYNDILTCYYDCLMRVEVICEAWENSLSYSDPSGHADEICAPLSRDRENGTNKYLSEFEELYPDAKPSEPRS